jgi:hypothetical protein
MTGLMAGVAGAAASVNCGLTAGSIKGLKARRSAGSSAIDGPVVGRAGATAISSSTDGNESVDVFAEYIEPTSG